MRARGLRRVREAGLVGTIEVGSALLIPFRGAMLWEVTAGKWV